MNFRALVFGTRLIRRGDRAELLLTAMSSPPSRESAGECERWRYDETGTTTTFTVQARRIVSIEQHVGGAATTNYLP